MSVQPVYSGTYAQTVITVDDLIGDAYALCRMPTPTLTAEIAERSRRSLYYMCQTLVNKGIPLWCVTPLIFPLFQGTPRYAMPTGTIDVVNANRRTLTRVDNTMGTASATEGVAANAFDDDPVTLCQQVTALGNISIALTNSTDITCVGILPFGSYTATLAWECSQDNTTWTTLLTSTLQMTDDVYYISDLPQRVSAPYWRVRATSGTLNVRDLLLGFNCAEIPMGKLNRDDYFAMPQPLFEGDALQYWLDMQRDAPEMVMWPTPQNSLTFAHVNVQRPIMDVGDLTNSLDVPRRWYEAVLYELARRVMDFTPKPVGPDVRQSVEAKAKEFTMAAWNRETDGMPIHFNPALRRYTR